MSTDERSKILSFSEKIYRALLIAYPEDFRQSYGTEMVQAFGDLCRQKLTRKGLPGFLAVWLRALLDLILNAPAERLKTIRISSPPEKKPWLAALLSFVCMGLGQLYNRQFGKSIPLLLAGAGGIFLRHGYELSPAVWSIALAVSVVINVLAMVDAWRSAEKINDTKVARLAD